MFSVLISAKHVLIVLSVDTLTENFMLVKIYMNQASCWMLTKNIKP